LSHAPETATSSVTASADAAKEVGEATHLLEATGVKAVEVLVAQTLAGNADVNVAELKASVEKKLEKIATDVNTLNKDVAAASTVVASSTSVNLTTPSTTAFIASTTLIDSKSGMTTTTPSASTSPLTPQETVKATEQKVGEASKIVEQGIAEAKTLMDNNDLLGAIKKVQTLTEVKKDADTVVLEAKIISDTLVKPPEPPPTASTTPSVPTGATGS
jgi:hypothetical protein